MNFDLQPNIICDQTDLKKNVDLKNHKMFAIDKNLNVNKILFT